MPAKIAVIYWSLYGHIEQLAEEVAKGVKEVSGAEVEILQVKETLDDEAVKKLHGKDKNPQHKVLDPNSLVDYDGYIFGIPTRYGRAPAQFSTMFDRTGGLWAKGALVGKMAGIFTSTASQHGGQETTMFTTLPWLAHHGIIYVPIGYVRPELSALDEIVGGSAWGAGTIAAGDGSRQPTQKELAVAHYQGNNFATVLSAYVKGKSS